MTGTSTMATSTRTNHQAPQTTTSDISSLLTVVLVGLILVTLTWPVSKLEVGDMAPKSIKNNHAYLMVACCDSELDCVTPLFLAVTTGDLAKVRQALICTNPNISAGGMRPLHIAARNDYLEIVELLLEHGANPNV